VAFVIEKAGRSKRLFRNRYVNADASAGCSRRSALLRCGNTDIGFDFYRKVHRIGNKAFFVGVVMQLASLVDILLSANGDDWPKHNLAEGTTIGMGHHDAMGLINIAHDLYAGI
jgi:hypothetical protein